MKAELIPFQFHTHQVRILPHEDGVSFWVVANDVTDILGYARGRNALRMIPDKHKGARSVSTHGGEQQMLCIDEAGLYRLVLRSDKPEAEPFMEWVTAEVLPSIRRTGSYGNAIPKIGDGPLTLAQFEQLQAALQAAHAALMAAPVVLSGADCLALKINQIVLKTAHQRRSAHEAVELIIQMEAEGRPRAEIVRATGKTFNYVRQVIFQARRDGLLPKKQGGAA
jgi:prophage antirepressor-like protein